MSNDAVLLEAWSHGDKAAGQALIERHYGAIDRFFRTKTKDSADDLVQRTFLRFAEARSRFRGASSVKSFLFGIARNVLLEHFRQRSRDARVVPDFGVSSIRELGTGISTLVGARSEHRLLVQALQHLPVDMQITLELHYWEELTVVELAEALDIPPGTVKSRLHRGRLLLRETMEKLPASPEDRESVRRLIDAWAEGIRATVG